jgi:hypothetical protein
MTNFYNVPALAIKLEFMKTDCVGTLCLNGKDVPRIVKEKKVRKREIITQYSGLVSVLTWCDKKKSP